MKKSNLKLSRYFVPLVYILTIVLITGCASVKLVGDYDAQIDEGVTALQKDTETLLVALEGSAEKDTDKVEGYDKHKEFYEKAKVNISSLRVRADAAQRNSLTVRMLDKLMNNIKRLEEAHKSSEGIKKSEIKELFRPGFNTQFTAILTFELAKKRGEKPDEKKAAAPATETLNQSNGENQ